MYVDVIANDRIARAAPPGRAGAASIPTAAVASYSRTGSTSRFKALFCSDLVQERLEQPKAKVGKQA